VIAIAAATSAFAEDHRAPFEEEVRDIMMEFADRAPASLTFAELEELSTALSVPAQKAAYVRSSAIASMLMPGMGQFKNGDALSGTLFLLADVAVTAGTAVGLYSLLPAELRFDQLDYLDTPYTDIKATWQAAYESATFRESLPFWGVATGGMLVKHVISHVSARHAGRLAMENIESGNVTFEPRIGPMSHGGPFGIGFGLRY
jgi:hypothetical protein